MRAIILAAGMGKRLQPFTNNIPKCMVPYKEKPIIDTILEKMYRMNFESIAVVTGYKNDVLIKHINNSQIKIYHNPLYDSTNMVFSLFCARDFFDQDCIISYSDIVYEKHILDKICDDKNDFSIVVDKAWKPLWEKRFLNPLEDLETFEIQQGNVSRIGSKPKTYSDIHGQYIGLLKISKNGFKIATEIYEKLKKEYPQEVFNNIQMTEFIQILINLGIIIKPVFIEGSWMEIDSVSDLSVDMIKTLH